MSDSLRDKIAAVLANHLTDDYVAGKCDCGEKTDDGHSTHQADAVIRELSELQVPQRFMLSIASQDAEGRRLDAASWLEKELTSAGLECGAGWVLYNLVDGVIARLNGVAE